VLIDTIIVRSVVVTALNLDLGDRIWWPSRLSRPSGQVTEAPGTPVTTARPEGVSPRLP
jgi:RND superfamily putative drug exporter